MVLIYRIQAIELLSNAVMVDERVFNLRNEKFIEQYNRQSSLTSTIHAPVFVLNIAF
jgi:hypothetical protein